MIQPLEGNVYVKREVPQRQTDSGILIAQSAAEKERNERVLIYGTVEEVGKGIEQVAKGDLVIFPRYEAWPLDTKKSADGEEFIVAEKHICARVINT